VGVEYAARLQGSSLKGTWKYPANNDGITLNGEFEGSLE
jgi:hypothetical protein